MDGSIQQILNTCAIDNTTQQNHPISMALNMTLLYFYVNVIPSKTIDSTVKDVEVKDKRFCLQYLLIRFVTVNCTCSSRGSS